MRIVIVFVWRRDHATVVDGNRQLDDELWLLPMECPKRPRPRPGCSAEIFADVRPPSRRLYIIQETLQIREGSLLDRDQPHIVCITGVWHIGLTSVPTVS